MLKLALLVSLFGLAFGASVSEYGLIVTLYGTLYKPDIETCLDNGGSICLLNVTVFTELLNEHTVDNVTDFATIFDENICRAVDTDDSDCLAMYGYADCNACLDAGRSACLYQDADGSVATLNSDLELNALCVSDGFPCFENVSDFTLIQQSAVCPAPNGGCTYSVGWWKNNNAEAEGDAQVPWPISETTLLCSQEWLELVSATPMIPANATTQLARQLIAARLNEANGAEVPAIVATAMGSAEGLLNLNCLGKPVSQTQKKAYNVIKEVLEQFNNGAIGPGQCADDETDATESNVEEGTSSGSTFGIAVAALVIGCVAVVVVGVMIVVNCVSESPKKRSRL